MHTTAALVHKARNAYARIPYGRWWTCLLLSAGYTVLLGALFGIRYEVNDDAIISNIAAGAYGPDTQFLVYVNVLLGYFLKPFYALAPTLNWFVLLLLPAGVFCFAYMGLLLMRRFGTLRGGALYLALLVLAGENFFTRFHYVKYAGLLLTTGILVLALRLGEKRFAVWGGVLVALLGSMLRFEQFAGIGGLAAPLLLWRFFHLDGPAKKRAVAQVGALVLCAFALSGIDTAIYNATPGWREYSAFNEVRTEISDYRLQFATPEDIAPLGYSENDFDIIYNWSFYDNQVFPLEKLQEIEQALPYNTLGVTVKTTIYMALRMLYRSPVNLLFAAVLLGWLFLSNKKRWPVVLGTLVMLGAMLLYLNWRGRYLLRIDYVLTLAALVFCFCGFSPPKKLLLNGVCFVSLLLIIATLPTFAFDAEDFKNYWGSRPARAEAIDFMSEDKDTLYLLDTDLVDAGNGYDVWHARPKDYFSNLVFVGSWLMDSPFQNDALAAYGLENPYRDAVGRDDVLLADFFYRYAREVYYHEHYDPGVQIVLYTEHTHFNLHVIRPGAAGEPA